jgi:hypothetical protein
LISNKNRLEGLRRDARLEWLLQEPEMSRLFYRIIISPETEEADSKYLDILETHIKMISPRIEMMTINGEDALVFLVTKGA